MPRDHSRSLLGSSKNEQAAHWTRRARLVCNLPTQQLPIVLLCLDRLRLLGLQTITNFSLCRLVRSALGGSACPRTPPSCLQEKIIQLQPLAILLCQLCLRHSPNALARRGVGLFCRSQDHGPGHTERKLHLARTLRISNPTFQQAEFVDCLSYRCC